MKPIAATSILGKVMIALRAGEMTAEALQQRFGYYVGTPLTTGRKAGLIEGRDSTYRLTAKGRELCPLRNPRAAATNQHEARV